MSLFAMASPLSARSEFALEFTFGFALGFALGFTFGFALRFALGFTFVFAFGFALAGAVVYTYIYSFIPAISIAPLQVLYYSEALPTDYSTDTVSEFHAEAHRQLQVKDLPKVPTWRLERESNPQPSG